MKILFWNIGKRLSDKKQELIQAAINNIKPDIFCIAEGSVSKADCQKIVALFVENSFYCYYSPLFSEELKLPYGYDPNGLKIFVKVKSILSERFSFPNQRKDGRIVILKANVNTTPAVIVFLHNK